MQRLKTVFRWLAVLPAWFLASSFATLAFNMGSCQYDETLARDLTRDMEGFGGHLILGPIIVAFRSVAAGWAGMAAVAYVAPAAKRETSFVTAGMVAMLAVVLLGFCGFRWHAGAIRGETMLRFSLDLIPATIVGFLVAATAPHGLTTERLETDHTMP